MRVLITDGNARAALAVTRSLGRAGHEVFVGESSAPALSHASRYCARRLVYPDPRQNSSQFVDAVARMVRDHAVDVLLPIADVTMFLLVAQRDCFEPSCTLPFADIDVVQRAADKAAMMDAANRLGVPTPRTVQVERPDALPDGLEFPLVVKPARSRVRSPNGWLSTFVSYAGDRAALQQDLKSRSPHDFPVMLQERIVGPGIGVFALFDGGQPVALFSHRRLREKPPWGGVSVLSESVELCPVARDGAVKLLSDLGWRGVAMVEFKRDVRDGLPKLMEINGRFWGTVQLAVDAGVDFPRLLVQCVDGSRIENAPAYRAGVRQRWFWGDVDSLLSTLFGDRSHWSAPNRARAMLSFLKLWGRNLHYDNPKWDDPRPWLFESRQWLGSSFHAFAATGRYRVLKRA